MANSLSVDLELNPSPLWIKAYVAIFLHLSVEWRVFLMFLTLFERENQVYKGKHIHARGNFI